MQSLVSGARWLIVLQLTSRALTFLFNIFVVRSVSTELLGLVSHQMQLIQASILFFARETVRRACLKEHDELLSWRLSLWVWPLGLLAACAVPLGFWLTATSEELAIAGYGSFLALVAVASWLELAVEPLYVAAQRRALYRQRVVIEAAAVVVRGVLTQLLLLTWQSSAHIFAAAQIAYAVVLAAGWLALRTALLPADASLLRLDMPTAQQRGLLATLAVQSAQKLFLQEGQNHVIRFTLTLPQQGVYTVVSNLSALVVRFLFQPVEESCYATFSRYSTNSSSHSSTNSTNSSSHSSTNSTNSSSHSTNPSTNSSNSSSHSTNSSSHSTNSTDQLAVLPDEAFINLWTVVRFVTFVGMMLASFGPHYSFFALDLLYGDKLSGTAAPTTLAWFSVYLLLLAVNGTAECFVHAVASNRTLGSLNTWHLLISSLYLLMMYYFAVAFHVPGLVMAGCLMHALRAALSVYYIASLPAASPHLRSPANFLLDKRLLIAFAACAPILSVASAPRVSGLSPINTLWINAPSLAVGATAATALLFLAYRTGTLSLFLQRHQKTA